MQINIWANCRQKSKRIWHKFPWWCMPRKKINGKYKFSSRGGCCRCSSWLSRILPLGHSRARTKSNSSLNANEEIALPGFFPMLHTRRYTYTLSVYNVLLGTLKWIPFDSLHIYSTLKVTWKVFNLLADWYFSMAIQWAFSMARGASSARSWNRSHLRNA